MSSSDANQTLAAPSGDIDGGHHRRSIEEIQHDNVSSSSYSEQELERTATDAAAVHQTTTRQIVTRQMTSDTFRNGLQRQDSIAMLDEDERRELTKLATARSQARRGSLAAVGEDGEAPVDVSDPTLDPTSNKFDLSKWLRNVVSEFRKEGITPATAGVVFRNLNVRGTGDELQLQTTLGDMLQAPLRLGEYFSFGKKTPKTILHRFDGLVRSGELLIVLGRPGSGCSTLLKTMTGQLHGLTLDPKSVHYNGIPQTAMMKEFKGEAIYNQEAS
jgi:ATPase subunit of ABC transporter with duplicated ATPase domains